MLTLKITKEKEIIQILTVMKGGKKEAAEPES